MQKLSTSALVLALSLSFVSAGGALAAPCRDSKGKFIKCVAPVAAPGGKCRDIKTKKFAKCGAPGTEPLPKS